MQNEQIEEILQVQTEVEPEHAGRDRSPEAKAALNTMQARLQGKNGRLLWKSFEELADTPEFKTWVDDEFPDRNTVSQLDRRRFLTLSGAAMAMAGLTGCRILPQIKAVPYVRAPEEMIVGKPLTYATAIAARSSYATGVLVESYDGRPIKVEGNPNHPASLGATLPQEQAFVLGLYDPDRSQNIYHNGELASWDQFYGVARKSLIDLAASGGVGISLLTETVTSPTLGAQIAEFLSRYPQAKWHQYEPVNRDNVYAGTEGAFGRPLNPVYRLKGAKVIVSLDANFFAEMPGSIRYARDWADGRRVRKNRPVMNRLYVVESAYTITGAKADHRVAVKPSDVERVARSLYAAVVGGAPASSLPSGVSGTFIDALARDLKANRGACVVVPGEQTTPATQALAHAMNSALGAVGATVVYTAPVETRAENQNESLRSLVEDMNAGRVQMLLIMGANPVYTAPADLKFQQALTAKNGDRDRVPLRIRLGQHVDETSIYCHWHLPEAHPFEAWSDIRAYDGTTSVVQPIIAPLYDGRSAHEVLAGLIGEPKPGYDILRSYWTRRSGAADRFDNWWERVLNTGVIPNTAEAPITVAARGGADTAFPAPSPSNGLEIGFRPDPGVWDGRYANNSWLQELPKPITTVSWDNVAHISPRTAKALKVIDDENDNNAVNVGQKNGQGVVTLTVNGTQLQMPVWVLPGQPDDTVTVHLGFGRTQAGKIGGSNTDSTQGFDVYPLRSSSAMGFAAVQLQPDRKTYTVSSTQAHHMLRGINETKDRNIIRVGTIQEYAAKQGDIFEEEHVAHLPEATGFPEGSEHETGAEARKAEGHSVGSGVDAADGEGAQPRNVEGHNNSVDQGETIVADAYRKQWEYVDKSSSNKEGWPSMYPEYSNKGFNAWGMSIDLTTCTGCNACVIACQAENNIPTVGKEMVGRGREMHWIRIDHYYSSEPDLSQVESHFQPLMCVHCEKAPCEPVCPVAATIHSHEGINQMIYNRCIGTRYCSNNCPYKVRRFNYLKWTAGVGGPTTINYELPVLKMLANPDVTVRGRGVMEKCTYCVQRISAKRIEAKKEAREIQDGEIVTACQQACPTRAIVFGDINNSNSEVSQLRKEPQSYWLLSDLNTRPRTNHMGQIKNPNPEISPTRGVFNKAGKEGDEGEGIK